MLVSVKCNRPNSTLSLCLSSFLQSGKGHHGMRINTLLLNASSDFLRKWLQNDKETTGFIRLWDVVSPTSQNIVFPIVFLAFWGYLGAPRRATGPAGPAEPAGSIPGNHLAQGPVDLFFVYTKKKVSYLNMIPTYMNQHNSNIRAGL